MLYSRTQVSPPLVALLPLPWSLLAPSSSLCAEFQVTAKPPLVAASFGMFWLPLPLGLTSVYGNSTPVRAVPSALNTRTAEA